MDGGCNNITIFFFCFFFDPLPKIVEVVKET